MTKSDKLRANKEEIIKLVNEGWSCKKLGKKYGCNSGLVYQILKEFGVKSKYSRSPHYGKAEKFKEEIIKRFESGESCLSIAKSLKRDNSFVVRNLQKWGYDTSRGYTVPNNRPPLKDSFDEIKKMYIDDGLSTNKIAEIVGASDPSVWKLLKDNGVQLRDKTKFYVNEEYLDNIDTPEKAYFLGLYYADGCTKSDRITVALQETDKNLLDAIYKDMDGGGELYYRPPKNERCKAQYELCVTRKKIKDRMCELGAGERKCYDVRLPGPKIIPSNLMSYFIAGNMMGDGHIKKRNSRGCVCSFTSNYYFVYELDNFIYKNCGAIKTNFYQQAEHRYEFRKIEDSTVTLSYSRILDIKKVFQYIYVDNPNCKFFKYDRKYKLALEYLDKWD